MSDRDAGMIAAEAGCTVHQVRLALILRRTADRGGTLADSCVLIGRKPATARRIARRWLIDFPDYIPFARRKSRPAPIGRLTMRPPASPACPPVLDAPAVAAAGVGDIQPQSRATPAAPTPCQGNAGDVR